MKVMLMQDVDCIICSWMLDHVRNRELNLTSKYVNLSGIREAKSFEYGVTGLNSYIKTIFII